MVPTPPPAQPPLTKVELYETFRRAGFPALQAVTMGAIALRESGGVPSAFNGNAGTGDRSYGLVQINMRDPNVAALLNRTVLQGRPETALLNADVNAQAAFKLWAYNNANLNVAWYIEHKNPDGSPSVYMVKYQAHLADMHAAALQSTLA